MPAMVLRVSPAARAQRASSAGRISRSYSCVPRGIRPRRYSAATIASRKDLRLRLMVETNRAPPGRSRRASGAVLAATLARLLRPGGALFVSTINRNLRSFLLAIVGAEYLLGLIPRGTHEYERLIRPAELARWARAAGLTFKTMAGIELNPFTRRVALTRDVAVNYLAHFQR